VCSSTPVRSGASSPGPAAPVLLDVRWALGDPHGRDHHRAGHLPGAVYIDLDTELAAPPTSTGGRHPLPELADLQAAARRWGVDAGSRVVAYDATGGTAAARAWWLLRWAGVPDVRLLDGGLAAWTDTGGVLEAGPGRVPTPGDVTLTGGGMPVLDADGAARLARDGLLLDARAGARYRGEVEPVDPRAGHVPGSVSAPTTDNLTPTAASSTRPRSVTGSLGPAPRPAGPSASTAVPASPPRTRSPLSPAWASRRRCSADRGRRGPPTRPARRPPGRSPAEPRRLTRTT